MYTFSDEEIEEETFEVEPDVSLHANRAEHGEVRGRLALQMLKVVFNFQRELRK